MNILLQPWVTAMVAACALPAWALPASVERPTPTTTLTVSAAASLQNAMRDIARAYEALRPGVRVQLNTGASGALLAQIAQGAPVDVLAAADAQTMQRAQLQRLVIAATRIDMAANTLVLVSPRAGVAAAVSAAESPSARGAALQFKSLVDLAAPAVRRIAIGTPSSVPAGRYAQAALESQGLWQALRPKLVYADSARQVLNYVARGEVDAGLAYRTDALLDERAVRIDLTVPTPSAVVYPMAVVATSKQPVASLDFVRFVAAPAAQAVLARYGFLPVPAAAAANPTPPSPSLLSPPPPPPRSFE